MNALLRLATPEDIPAALDLCRIAGWNQRNEDWARLLRYEPQGCFAADVDGTLVGTVTTTSYGSELAWIGMMLVHPDFRRQGIATRLMNRALDYLRDRQVRCIKLDATPEGQQVYEKIGFRSEWTLRRWMRASTDQPAVDLEDHPYETGHGVLVPYLALDRKSFGVDRQSWLLNLLPDSLIQCQPRAIGMLRRGYLASYLGPMVASRLEDARSVVSKLCDETGDPIFWDIPDQNQPAIEIAEAFNFRPVRHLVRMWTGSELVESDLNTLFALSDPGTG